MIHPILLTIWAVLAISFMGLLIYRGQLTRYEDEQLFLLQDDSNAEREQSALVRRVKQLQPLVNMAGAAAGLVTAGVVGLYVWQAWQRIQ
jgi:hypothetical protein